MTGRSIFQQLKPAVGALSVLFSFIPRILFELTWPLFELVPWKLGIFLRYLCAKRLAKSCGDNVLFETGVRVTHWDEIELGSNVAIFETCYLDGKGGIKIGDNVSIAHQSSLISFEFDVSDPSIPLKYSAIRKKPIIIGNDVMIFSGVRVFAGATLENRTIIAANAVVREGVYPSGLYAGLPAKRKKSLS
jgi:acetyltransferase-like isoleucine patch superfamily enzyme